MTAIDFGWKNRAARAFFSSFIILILSPEPESL